MSASQMRLRRSPWLPTPLETIILSIYPGILLLGSLFSLLDPAARSAPYNAATHSHPAELAPSYFAKKGNLFNILFVKIGWLWISTVFLVFLFTHGGQLWTLTPRRAQALTRFSLATAWWIAVTKWFFGPALMDRTFVLTGGACEGKTGVLTSVACKAIGGDWRGGHDISGHVFLLVLGSSVIWMEVLYVALISSGVREERFIMGGKDGTEVRNAEAEKVPSNETDQIQGTSMLAFRLALFVSGLSLLMLFMTAAYFHTWFEKFNGLAVALLGVFTIYYLPRVVPVMRRYIGLPGI